MALTSVEIQKATTNFLEFQKGRMLSDQNAVTEMKCDSFWRGEVTVKAQVEETGNRYWIQVIIKQGQLKSFSCTCPQFHKEQGLCRHLAASLFHYQLYYQDGGVSSVFTSMDGRILLQKYQERFEAESSVQKETIFLEPKLILQMQKPELEFRIGDRHGKEKSKYLLKDLREFANCMLGKKEGSYGKQLSFYHIPEAFEPFSSQIADFIVRQMTQYDYFLELGSASKGMFEKIRRIHLKGFVADEWFLLLEGREIIVETASEMKICHVERKNPAVPVEFRRKGRDGVEVSIIGTWFFLYGLKSIYVIHENTIYICSPSYSNNLKDFFQMTKKGSVVFQERDFKTFCGQVLPYLEKKVSIQEYGIHLADMCPQSLHSSFFLDSPDGKNIICRFLQSYEDFSFQPLKSTVFPDNIRRNFRQEKLVYETIKQFFTQKDAEDHLVIYEDEDAVYRLLKDGIEQLKQIGEVYISEKIKQIKIVPMPQVSFGISFKGGLLELEMDSKGLSGEELFAILHSYREKKKWHRLKNGEFLELDQTGLKVLDELTKGLQLSMQQVKKKQALLPKYRAFYIDAVFKNDKEDLIARNSYFNKLVQQIKWPDICDVPPILSDVMKEYQKEGFQWIKTLKAYGFGGILADDMGLGKSLQIIAFLLSEKELCEKNNISLHPALIVCPTSLIYNWEHEFFRFAPCLKVVSIVGNTQEREVIRAKAADFDVLITSYDLLRRDGILYKEMEFSTMVIDEAQYIKNHTTQSAKAVKAIQASFRLALTGTPIENHLSELWSIFDFLMPGFLYSYTRFRTEFEIPIVKQGDSYALERLHQMIGPFLMRRLKKDVLNDLPEKLEEVIYSKMDGMQDYLYQAAVMELKKQLVMETEESFHQKRISILSQLMRLRQICCDPSLCFEGYEDGSAKLNTCMELILRAVQSGHKILLFSQFTSMLEKIQNCLKEESISYYLLTGATSKEERMELVDRFQQDETSVFLISLKAGGTGLNLTAADIVIHYDPWWNMAAQNQATDRTHRIGQHKMVTVYRLITKNTIEDNILKLQESKQYLADQVLHTDGAVLSSMNREELLRILE